MSIHLKYTAQIERPLEAVGAVITDIPGMVRWSSLKEVRNISSGPLQVGARFQVVTDIGGKDRLINYQVTAYEPCKKFAYQGDGKYPTAVTMTLQPIETGTKLTFEFSLQVNRFIASLIRGTVQEQTAGDLERLVSVIEKGHN